MKGLKLNTPVEFPSGSVKISCGDRIAILGSCFAGNIGKRLKDRAFDVCLNPFGTLYNPASVADSIARLDSGEHFRREDCVQVGSGSTKWCSFHHHTLAAKDSPEEFLEAANRALDEASAFWKDCGKVIITLGTSWCFRHIGTGNAALEAGTSQSGLPEPAGSPEREDAAGMIVANCLKRDAKEFTREFMPASRTAELLRGIVSSHPDKQFIFTVSPIRHFKDGAHGNSLSKSSLLLGIDGAMRSVAESRTEECTGGRPGAAVRCEYFPAYEIMLDELRDYRFYATDMLHPSEQAAEYIFERFIGWALPEGEREEFERRDRVFRQSLHIRRDA